MRQMGPQLCAQHPTSQWDSQGAAWASTRGMDSGTGTAAFHFSPDISVALSSQSLLPWFLSIHCILLSSSLPVSVLFSLSLFQEGSHSMPSCCLFWFFSSPCPRCWAPALLSLVYIHFPCSASPPALLSPCPKAGAWSCPLGGQRGAFELHTWS